MIEEHTWRDAPQSLNGHAFAAKTSGGTRSGQQTKKSRSGLGIRRPGCPRPAHYDRTGRNPFESSTPGLFLDRSRRLTAHGAEKSIDLSQTEAAPTGLPF